MKCEKCGNEYPSHYYFATEKICKDCFFKMLPEEQLIQNTYSNEITYYDEFAWRAGFGYRFGAALLDYFFYSIILLIILMLSGIISEYQFIFKDILANQKLLEEFIFAILPYVFIVTFMYYSLEIVLAATPGKMMLGLQIANDDRTHARYDKLIIRFFFKHMDSILSLIGFFTVIEIFDTISSIVGLIILVGFFFVLSPKRQAFHDMIANTAVFRRKDINLVKNE